MREARDLLRNNERTENIIQRVEYFVDLQRQVEKEERQLLVMLILSAFALLFLCGALVYRFMKGNLNAF